MSIEITLPGSPPVAVNVRFSRRARNYILRVPRFGGNVRLTVPAGGSLDAAQDFARSRETWLRKALARQDERIVPACGGTILFAGRDTPLVPGTGRDAVLVNGAIRVPGAPRDAPRHVRTLLVATATRNMVPVAEECARLLGRTIRRFSFKDTRTRWGSCSAAGNIMFSWRLAMAPEAVQAYVAVHEACHLAVMDHSAAFWSHVAALCPDHADRRAWLRRYGPRMHLYDFDSRLTGG